jgi:hypothetical protein
MFHLIAKMFHLLILSYIRFLRSELAERCSQKSATHSTLRPCAIALASQKRNVSVARSTKRLAR